MLKLLQSKKLFWGFQAGEQVMAIHKTTKIGCEQLVAEAICLLYGYLPNVWTTDKGFLFPADSSTRSGVG